jgi:hypothetical protein
MLATRRWTRELEQRFSKAAVLNPDIEDRLTDDLTTFDNLSSATEITGGTQDAVDEKSYRVRIFNRPTHQGDLSQLEQDFDPANYDGFTPVAASTPNADNRDRPSGWGVTVPADNVPGAGAWDQPSSSFATADLPNTSAENETDYVDPDDAPVGAPVESGDPSKLLDADQDGTPNNEDPDYTPGDEYEG